MIRKDSRRPSGIVPHSEITLLESIEINTESVIERVEKAAQAKMETSKSRISYRLK
jgi:hypothetical protein